MSDPNVVVVGAGLYGLTAAQQLAERGARVSIYEARDHIAGNAYSEVDSETNIEVHRYGAHIFHTSNERVWSYVNRFASFSDYRHTVWALRNGQLHPLPFGLATLSSLLGRAISPDEAEEALERSSPLLSDEEAVETFESKALGLIGRPLYEAFVRDYTAKQWDTSPQDLPPSVISRLPFRLNYQTDYFSDTHQGMPTRGYTDLAEALVDSPRIEVNLGQRLEGADLPSDVPVIWSGPIDQLMDYELGQLHWRTVKFDVSTVNVPDYQGTSVVNYSDPSFIEPATRCIEYRHFHPERRDDYHPDKTIIAKEYSSWANPGDEPYYPVGTSEDRQLVKAYRREAAARWPNLHLGGRLGSYHYLDMHMAIASALTLSDSLGLPRSGDSRVFNTSGTPKCVTI